MKITVNQLRKIIKEEISRALNESSGEEILKKIQGSFFLRNKVNQMSKDPDSVEGIAEMWDEAVSKVPEMMEYVKANSKPGYINSTARNQAVSDAAASSSDPEASVYFATALNRYLEKKEELTGDDLKLASTALSAMPKQVSTYVPGAVEAEWDATHPYRSWRST